MNSDVYREVFAHIKDVRDRVNYLVALGRHDICHDLRRRCAAEIRDQGPDFGLSYETLHVRCSDGSLQTHVQMGDLNVVQQVRSAKAFDVVASTAGSFYQDHEHRLYEWNHAKLNFEFLQSFRHPVRQVATGANFMMVLSEGTVHGRGTNFWGQMTPTLEHLTELTPIVYSNPATHICCGTDHSVVLTHGRKGSIAVSRGRGMTCDIADVLGVSAGETHSVVQRGDGRFQLYFSRPIHLNHIEISRSQPNHYTHGLIYNLKTPPHTRSVLCGGDFSVAVDEKGNIFVLGRGFAGNWKMIATGVGDVVCSRYQLAYSLIDGASIKYVYMSLKTVFRTRFVIERSCDGRFVSERSCDGGFVVEQT